MVLPLIADCVVEAILAFVLSWTNYYIASCMSGSNIFIMTCIHGRLTQRFSSLVPAVAAILCCVSLVALTAAIAAEYLGD